MPFNIMNRESLMAARNLQIPFLPILAVRGHLCFRCLLPSKRLNKCSGCKRAVYCGKACQIHDWEVRHKKDCKILQMMNEIEMNETAPSRTRSLWTTLLDAKAQLMKEWTTDMSLIHLIISQPYCTTCHRGAVQIPPPTKLKLCPVCHLVFTCETCTLPSSHECELYQQIGSIEKFLIQRFESSGQFSCIAPGSIPRSSLRAPLTPSSWHEYFKEVAHEKHLVSTFVNSDFSLDEALLRTLPNLEMKEAVRRAWLFSLIATKSLAMPLTILAALEDSLSDFAARKTVLIHLIGASGTERANFMLFEEILHLVPSLQTLRIILIGPGCAAAAEQTTKPEFAIESCPACSSRGNKRTIGLYGGLYHNYAEEIQYEKPDLAVLFHSGRSQAEQESWRPTTEFLVESDTLTICTTFTYREAREEVAELETLKARFIRELEVNKWKSLVPLPQNLEGEEHEVFYGHYYRYIFQGRR